MTVYSLSDLSPRDVRDAVGRSRLADLLRAVDRVGQIAEHYGIPLAARPLCPWCGRRGIEILDSVRLVCCACGRRSTRYSVEILVLGDADAISALLSAAGESA